MAEPTQEGQAPKTPVEVVAQVLPSSKFLQNVGLQPAGANKRANTARVHELEAEVQQEKQVAAALQEVIDSQRDEMEDLKKKMSASEEVSQIQEVEIKMLKQQGEETNSLLRRLLSLNKEQADVQEIAIPTAIEVMSILYYFDCEMAFWDAATCVFVLVMLPDYSM